MKPITLEEIQSAASTLYTAVCAFEAGKKDFAARSNQLPWYSVTYALKALGLCSSGRNKTLVARTKRYMKAKGLVQFIKPIKRFVNGKAIADYFVVLGQEALKTITEKRQAFKHLKAFEPNRRCLVLPVVVLGGGLGAVDAGVGVAVS